ncbi:MAG: BMC domain-containing protein [Planctomycetota bacterium]|jgi:microcompartment protein CcmL/EutN|nr:BMC domain-containing protein [Planctomycetota bacterium]MDP6763468.1 BMC domain-containing protein [Planctomycetota bacterium]MDP6990296.1 BMC domain-containing protein [Planctomycetota bacterium]
MNDRNPQLRTDVELEPAIGLLELCSVARGVETADAILWTASIEMLFAEPVQPGKYVMLFTGDVQDLESALARGAEAAGCDLVDRLLIQQVHEQVPAILQREGKVNGTLDALGIVETTTVASAILSADAALKRSTVDLLELRIANGLGGKSFFTLTGEVSDVRSAVAAGAELAGERGLLVRDVVIARPHADLVRHL